MTKNDDELIDIYDASLHPRGRKKHLQAHLDGDWHRTFHCWVIRMGEDPAMLFQLRSEHMPDDPNKWDVSAAGHLLAGENVEDGSREISEELGIDFKINSLIFGGERVEVSDNPNGMKNREYQSVYFLPSSLDIAEFNPQVSEIAGLLWLSLDDGIALFDGSISSVTCEGKLLGDPDRLEHTDASGKTQISITVSDFLPRIQRYYVASMICAQRIVRGEFPIAIS